MDEYTSQQLEKTPITKLKEIAKKYGVKGHTAINKTNKDDFVSKIIEHIDLLKTVPQLTEKKIKEMDKKTLVQYATVLKVERISLMNKPQLQEQILKAIKPREEEKKEEKKKPREEEKKPREEEKKEEKKKPREEEKKEEKKKPREEEKKEEKIPNTKQALLDHLEKKGISHLLSKNKTVEKLKAYAKAERCDLDKNILCSDDELVCDIRNNACLNEEDLPKRNYKISKIGNKKIGGETDVLDKKLTKQKKEKQPESIDYSKLKIPELREILKKKGINTKYRGFDNKKDLINYIQAETCDEKTPCKDSTICDLRNNICVEEEVLPRREISKYENYAGTEAQIKKLIKSKEPEEEIIEEKKEQPEEVYLEEEEEEKKEQPEEVYLEEEEEEKKEQPEEVYLEEEEEEKKEQPEEVYLEEEEEEKKEQPEEVYLEEEEEEKKEQPEEVYLEEEEEEKPEDLFETREYAKKILLSTREDDEYIHDVIEEIQESEDENLYEIKRSIYKSLGLIR
jgi:hypothetical protein